MKDLVCVTGASGGIGQALMKLLLDQYTVRALFRAKSKSSDEWTERGCTPVWGGVEETEALSALLKRAKYVFHCAALVARAPYQQAYAINVDGTRRLAELAAKEGCERFIHVSSIAVYSGITPHGDYSEDLCLRREHDMAVYAATKLEAELALQQIAAQHDLDYTIVRPTFVYGPNVKSYTLMPLTMIRKGLPVIIGDGEGIIDAIYVDDVARALVLAAQSPLARREAFNIGHQAVTANAFYSNYGRMLNKQVSHLRPAYVRRISALFEALPDKPNFVELRNGFRFMVRTSANTKLYPASKAERLLGYAPQYTLPAGMLETEIWAKRAGIVPSVPSTVEAYGTLRFRPSALVHPETGEELAQVVRIAVKSRLTVRAIGSLHSQCPIPETDGICVVLDRYKKVLKVEDNVVTVQAGIILRELHEALASHNLALPVSGSIAAQTVAGAISTATHGGSMHHGTLSDCVDAVSIVRADASIEHIDRSHPAFPAAFVSMGLLGVLSTVTFRCVPRFTLESRPTVMKIEDLLAQFDEINRSNLHVDMLYYPITGEVALLLINPVKKEINGRAPAGESMPDRPAKRSGVRVTGPLERSLKLGAIAAAAWILKRGTPIQKRLARLSTGSAYQARSGRSDSVLAFGDGGTSTRLPGVLSDAELAIPYEQAPAAIGMLCEHFRRTRRFPLLPIHIRCSRRSELWMSPTYERDVCWLEIWQYPQNAPLLGEISHLLEQFQYRFHWGKARAGDVRYIRQQYPKWNDFIELRRNWDPQGLFLNQYLTPFFS
jgi:L-gulono-1,4-lactone dehydrogenase